MTVSPSTPGRPNTAVARREVRYATLGAILEDAEFLAIHPHQTTGQWSYGRILQHLADGVNASFDGFPYRVNVFVRIVGTLLFKRKVIEQEMTPGFKLPKSAEENLPKNETPVSAALENLKRALARFEKSDPTAAHPVFGKLTRDEWVKLHLNHAALHMSFVKPA